MGNKKKHLGLVQEFPSGDAMADSLGLAAHKKEAKA